MVFISLSLSSIFTLCFHNSGISFLSTYPSSLELEGTLLGTGEGRKWKRERGRGERERMWSGEGVGGRINHHNEERERRG